METFKAATPRPNDPILYNGRSDIMAMVARSDFTITYVPDISTEEVI